MSDFLITTFIIACIVFSFHLVITCPKLVSPENGQVYTSSLKVAAEANYVCDYGHKLVGESPRRCKGNGQWSGTAPICQSADTY